MNRISTIIKQVRSYLVREEKDTEKVLSTIVSEDPFKNPDHQSDQASSDTNAQEQEGHLRSETLKNELSLRLSAIRKALGKIKSGTYGTCENCGNPIRVQRLLIMPMATLCISCESKKEKN